MYRGRCSQVGHPIWDQTIQLRCQPNVRRGRLDPCPHLLSRHPSQSTLQRHQGCHRATVNRYDDALSGLHPSEDGGGRGAQLSKRNLGHTRSISATRASQRRHGARIPAAQPGHGARRSGQGDASGLMMPRSPERRAGLCSASGLGGWVGPGLPRQLDGPSPPQLGNIGEGHSQPRSKQLGSPQWDLLDLLLKRLAAWPLDRLLVPK